MSKTTFKIQRFNPEKDKEPHFQEFKLEIPKGATLLDCLNLIKWTQDGTLTFRMSCRSAICGSCSVRANGHAVLACKTQASSVAQNDQVTIKPLGNMEIIKDLAVDLTEFWKKVEAIKPWLMPDENKETQTTERTQSVEEFLKIDKASTCIMCSSCYSDCCSMAVDKSFLGPTALAKAQRFVEDSRDKETISRIKELSEDAGIWDCTHCGECSQRCPTEAKPLDRIVSLRTVALNSGVTNNYGARHAKAFVKSIKSSGILNENTIPVASIGFFNIPGLLSLIPVGIRMFLKGKNPPLIHHPMQELDDVKRIFKKFEEK